MTEQLSEKDQQELLEKYDPEAGTRKLKGLTGVIAFVGLLAFSLFQLYTAIFGVFPAQIQRSVHLGFALGLIFLLFPATKGLRKTGKFKVAWYDAILAVLGAGVGAYWVANYETIVGGIGLITETDFMSDCWPSCSYWKRRDVLSGCRLRSSPACFFCTAFTARICRAFCLTTA